MEVLICSFDREFNWRKLPKGPKISTGCVPPWVVYPFIQYQACDALEESFIELRCSEILQWKVLAVGKPQYYYDCTTSTTVRALKRMPLQPFGSNILNHRPINQLPIGSVAQLADRKPDLYGLYP